MCALNRCPSLNNPRGGLDETKDNSKYQDERCDPECVPLDSLSIVIPPLGYSSRFRIIESLFENYQAVSPEFEIVDLAALGAQVIAKPGSRVQFETSLLLLKPFV